MNELFEYTSFPDEPARFESKDAELAQLRSDRAQLRADLKAARARISEYESGMLVEALLEANRTQADIIIDQARQLADVQSLIDQSFSDAVAIVNMSDDYIHEMSEHLANQLGTWLAANPAPPRRGRRCATWPMQKSGSGWHLTGSAA